MKSELNGIVDLMSTHGKAFSRDMSVKPIRLNDISKYLMENIINYVDSKKKTDEDEKFIA
jgi:hypothetical protein